MVEDKFAEELQDEINYRSLSSGRDFQSSTVWFRDKEGNVVGAVCINVDYSSVLRANEILEALAAPVRTGAGVVVEDTFAKDLEDLIEVAVTQYLRQEGIPSLEDMNRADKQGLIRTLEARGLFRIRGAVDQLVDLLCVSRATIYNYRSNASSDEED